MRFVTNLWMRALAVVASLISAALILEDHRNVASVFQFADPTGGYGSYLHLGSLLANLTVIFVGGAVLLRRASTGTVAAIMVFAAPILEAAATLPCFLSARPGSLCGLWAVVVAEFTIPLVVAAGIAFVWRSRSAGLRRAAIGGLVGFALLAAALQLTLAPSGPGDCKALPEMIKRSNCLNAFAQRAEDENLCRSIEFRSTRFLCLSGIAAARRSPALCREIADTTAPANYESPAAFFRDACFQQLAYLLRDPDECERVEDPQLRARCEEHVSN
jgi:hypothetical protein